MSHSEGLQNSEIWRWSKCTGLLNFRDHFLLSRSFIRAELSLRVHPTLIRILFPGPIMQMSSPACSILSVSLILSLCTSYYVLTGTRFIEHIVCVHWMLCEVPGTQERLLWGPLRDAQTNLSPESIRCHEMSYSRGLHQVLKDARGWSS